MRLLQHIKAFNCTGVSWRHGGHISNQRHFIFRIFALTEERMGVAILQAIEYETSQLRKVFRVIRRQNH